MPAQLVSFALMCIWLYDTGYSLYPMMHYGHAELERELSSGVVSDDEPPPPPLAVRLRQRAASSPETPRVSAMGASLDAAIAAASRSARARSVSPARRDNAAAHDQQARADGHQAADHAQMHASASSGASAVGAEVDAPGPVVQGAAAPAPRPGDTTPTAIVGHAGAQVAGAEQCAASFAAEHAAICSERQQATSPVEVRSKHAHSVLHHPAHSQPPSAEAPSFLVASSHKRTSAPEFADSQWQSGGNVHQPLPRQASAPSGALHGMPPAHAGLTAAQTRQLHSTAPSDGLGYGEWYHALWRVPVVDGAVAGEAQLPSERSGYCTERDESGSVSEAGGAAVAMAASALAADGPLSRAAQLREATRHRLLASDESTDAGSGGSSTSGGASSSARGLAEAGTAAATASGAAARTGMAGVSQGAQMSVPIHAAAV